MSSTETFVSLLWEKQIMYKICEKILERRDKEEKSYTEVWKSKRQMGKDQEFHSSWIKERQMIMMSLSLDQLCLIGIAIMAAKLHVCLLCVPIEEKNYELLRTMNERAMNMRWVEMPLFD